ncbi:MAG: adenosylcobinamide-GDP ribazoletransferase [Propionicimonas sp.]|uniref:adenosylcobinamide-GDP ribazoletransferase n=1 Tax=Propionicimonas sp. TaxID=1955623 RepID=UPI003D12DFD1
MSALAGLRLSVGLLTVVPVRPPAQLGRPEARAAMLLAPVAVLPVALASALVGWGAMVVGLPSALAGVLVVAGLALGTRAMHADGLADTTDALGSGKDAEGALAIMKRGDIGPMGTVALVLSLGAQAIASGVVLERPWGWVLLVVLLCLSRAALVLGCAIGVPAARPGGLGALVAGSVPVPAAVAVWLLGAAALCGAAFLTGMPWWQPVLAWALALLACLWLLRRCVRRFGGITGDVLGALVEVAASVLLVVLAASPLQG